MKWKRVIVDYITSFTPKSVQIKCIMTLSTKTLSRMKNGRWVWLFWPYFRIISGFLSHISEKTVFFPTPSCLIGKGTSSWCSFLCSPLLLVIWAKDENKYKLQQQIVSRHFPPRVTTLLVSYRPSNVYHSVFPINLLRNIGLRAVQTTHVCVLDSDLFLSRSFHNHFLM